MTLFLQGIFLTQGWTLDLLPCRQILHHLTLLYLSCRHYLSFIFIFWKQITNALFFKNTMLPHHHCHIPYINLKYSNIDFIFFFWYCCVQSLSCVWLSATPWIIACQVSLSFTISWSLLKLMSIESMMPPNSLILCHPLLNLSHHQSLF